MATTPKQMRLDDQDLAVLEAVRVHLLAKSDTDAVRQALIIAAKSLKIDLRKILGKTDK